MGVLIVDKFCPQHTDYVKTLAYAPATKRLASGGLDRLVVLWDLDVALSIGHYTRDIKSEVSLRVSRRVCVVCAVFLARMHSHMRRRVHTRCR